MPAQWTLSQWTARIRHEIRAGNPVRLTASLIDAQQFLSDAPHVPRDDAAWITLLRAVEDGLTATGQRHEYPTHRQASLTALTDAPETHADFVLGQDSGGELSTAQIEDSDETKLPWE